MSNGNAKMLDTITKLLALAEGKGTTPAESATAAAQASRLMMKYGIEQADVEAHGVDTTPDEEIERGTLWEGGRVIGWVLDLAAGLARLHLCRVLIRKASRRHAKGWGGDNAPNFPARITIVGTPSNASVVRYLLTYLMREIDRLALATDREAAFDAGVSVKAYRNAFRKGAASEVLRRMKWERNEHREEIKAAGKSTALVRVDTHDQAVQRFTDQHAGRGSYNGGGVVGSRSGLEAGKRAGRNIHVSQALSTGKGSDGGRLLN